jgi:iron complex outermembrane recepter protein
MSTIGLKAFHLGAAAVVLSSAVARSQEAPANNSQSLETVVVTASRFQTDLQKTPIAVTALSAQTLRDRSITTLLDVQNYVPDLSVGSRSGTGPASGAVAIRGMGQDANGSSAAVGIYEDEVYVPSGTNSVGSGNLLGFFDVGRVEVLRGPQGTLFGRNTIAGAIQYVTNEPEGEFGGYVDAIGGTDSRVDVQGALNVPLGDSLALRIAGMSTTEGGYVHDLYANTDRGAFRTQGGRLKARWTPTNRLTVDLKGEILHESTNGRAVLVSAVNPNAQFVALAQLFGETRPYDDRYISPGKYTSVGFNAPDYFHFQYEEGQAIVNYEIADDLNLKSISAYSETRTELAQDFDNSPLSILAVKEPDEKLGVFTQEVQLAQQSPSDRLRWTAGGYYYHSTEGQNPGTAITLGFAPPFYPYGATSIAVTSYAFYGQASYDITDRLSATAGLRYSHEQNKAQLIGSAPVLATFTDTSPYAGLNYQLDPDIMFYVKASKGFRAGGTTPNAALPGGGLAFEPETAWTYEGGARMEFLDHRLRVNPTIFLTDWKNIQFNVLIPTPQAPVAATNNVGDAQIKGFELESDFAATDRLTLNGTLSLLDGHYTRVSDLTYTIYPYGYFACLAGLPGACVNLPNVTLHTALQRAPRAKFSLGGQYVYPLANGSNLTATLNYTWTDKQQSAVTIADQVELPAYGVLNARLQYDLPGNKWSIAVFATNLTDQFYLVGGVDFAKGYTAGNTELDVARPREVGVELRTLF